MEKNLKKKKTLTNEISLSLSTNCTLLHKGSYELRNSLIFIIYSLTVWEISRQLQCTKGG